MKGKRKGKEKGKGREEKGGGEGRRSYEEEQVLGSIDRPTDRPIDGRK
jgi:hypothetical protein